MHQHSDIKISNRRILAWGIGFIALADFILMAFSTDRTAWLISLFESGQHKTAFGYAGAIVIELCAIAFIVSEILISHRSRLIWYIRLGLLLIVALQALANGIKGWQNGSTALADLFGSDRAIFARATWAIINGLIPGLIWLLSKLLAGFLAGYIVVLSNRARRVARAALARRLHGQRRQAVKALEKKSAALAARVDRLSRGRKATARRLKGLRRRLSELADGYATMIDLHTAAATQAEASTKAKDEALKAWQTGQDTIGLLTGQIATLESNVETQQETIETQARRIADLAKPSEAEPLTLDAVAAWLIATPEATIATLANEVRRQAGTHAKAAQAFSTSPASLTQWLNGKPKPSAESEQTTMEESTL